MRHLLPLTTLALFIGCTPSSSSDLTKVLPDNRILVNMPTDMAGNRAVGDWSEFYLTTAQVTEDVNGLIGGVLDGVNAITDFEPTWTDEGSTATWGPWDDGPLDPTEDSLWVHYDVQTDVHTWAIVQRPKGSTDDSAWKEIIVGQVEAGATEEDSTGWFIIDFDAAYALDPNADAVGTFASGYEVVGDDVTAYAAFEDFSDNPSEPETINALYHYQQAVDGDGQLDLAFEQDQTGDGQQESTYLRSRWTQAGAGRGDAVITGGELGNDVFASTECWDGTFQLTYGAEIGIDGTTGAVYTATEGDESSCVFAESSENDTWDDTDSAL